MCFGVVMIEDLPDELWHTVMTHASFKALARMALTNGRWAVRVRPAIKMGVGYSAVRDLILGAKADNLGEVLMYVELRYDLKLDLEDLPAHLPGDTGTRRAVGRGYVEGGNRARWETKGTTRAEKLSSLALYPRRIALYHELRSSPIAPDIPLWKAERHHMGKANICDGMCLVGALLLRLSPAEVLEAAEQEEWELHDLRWALPMQLRRAEWTPPLLAKLLPFLPDCPSDEVEEAAVHSLNLLHGFPRLTKSAVLRSLPLDPTARAGALFFFHCCEYIRGDWFVRASEEDSKLLASSLKEMQCGVSAICHVLLLWVEHVERTFEMECENGHYVVEDYSTADAFLGAWSGAVNFPVAFSEEDRAELLNCVQNLKPKARAGLMRAIIGWILAMQPTGFLGDACRAVLPR